MKDLISVVVPIYKVEKYLSNCIESILNQTYKNLEIILVNDGSPDKCGEICGYYEKKDKRIRVINKQNGGLSDARNAGIEIAKGKYISFIDSDDTIHENFYERLISLLISTGADIAQCNFLNVYEEDNIDEIKLKLQLDNYEQYTFTNIEALNNLYSHLYLSSVISCNKLYKIELFNGIRFPKNKVHEDEFTTYKVIYKSKKLTLTNEPLYFYLQRSTSITGEKFNIKRLDTLEAYSNQVLFFKERKLEELELKSVKRLEYLIRFYLQELLKSEIKNNKEIFNYLISYYRKYKFYNYFGGSHKLVSYSYHFLPNKIIKIISWLLEIRSSIIIGRRTKEKNKE